MDEMFESNGLYWYVENEIQYVKPIFILEFEADYGTVMFQDGTVNIIHKDQITMWSFNFSY